MKTKLSLLALFTIVAATVMSCKEDTEPPQTGSGLESTIVTIDATSFSDWTYFSFEQGKTVEVTDFATDMNWDIGFHRMNIRLNCGKSGVGKGGSQAMGTTDFVSIKTAPEDGYSLNDEISIPIDLTSMPPLMDTVPGDTVLAKWVNRTFVNQGPIYVPTEEIFVVKTANGKYVKLLLKDYYNANSESGYITMKYVYQNDGSTKLD